MENYLDPEEEFMLMHQDELEMLREMDEDELMLENLDPSVGAGRKSKRSLDFGNSENAAALQRSNSFGVEPIQPSDSSENEELTSSSHIKKPPVKRSLDAAFSSGGFHLTGIDKENRNKEAGGEQVTERRGKTQKRLRDPIDTDAGKKRSVDYLFGDINDIELEEIENDSKRGKARKKPCYEHDVQPPSPSSKKSDDDKLIEEILARRRSAKMPIYGKVSLEDEWKHNTDGITHGLPKWPFVPVTNAEGTRLYVRLKSEEALERECAEISSVHGKSTGLLSEPYAAVREAAILITSQKIDEAAGTDVQMVNSHETSVGSSLWVEKYKPKCYSELLSDATVNRALLHWLKLWDKVVFDIDKKPKQQKRVVQQDKGKGQWNNNPPWKNKGALFVSDDLDEHGRPMQKVVLLCGPPGLGKTTLAFVVARKAGYNVVEMNASDDRSPETFRTQLEAATQMCSVMGADPRPNCLVLDEIDGAPAPSIDVLVKFVAGKETAKGRGKKKEGRGFVLKRPVICICNDPYVPALRALRQVALVMSFPTTSADVLSNRLLEISRRERISTDLGAVLALCEKTGNDIRSCLSSLYYYKTRGGVVTVADIIRSSVGQKDTHKGLFAVWQEIFQVQRAKGNRAAALAQSHNTSHRSGSKVESVNIASRIENILHTVQTFGDYDRLAMGVFENYPNMKFKESSMLEVSIGTEWFCRLDLISTQINTLQDYSLMPYMPYAFAMWHVLFSSRERPKISYPNSSYEASVKLANNRYIVEEVMKGMSPAVRSYTNRRQLVLEVFPFLAEIIAPTFRAVSVQLYSAAEKQQLKNLVDIMIDFNLTYVQERSHEENYISKLDPNILDVVYGDKGAPSRFLSHTAKQIVAVEVEREKWKRLDMGSEESSNKDDKKASSKTTDLANKPVPLPLEKPKFDHIIKEQPKKDFFGRIIFEPQSPSTVKAKAKKTTKGNIWFHFKEGYNNAVRRKVRMEALM